MSLHFSANQYENAFSPGRLQNYEVPAEHKMMPSARTGMTKIITNDFGHIQNPKHRSTASSWGSFVGTWQAERKPLDVRTKTEFKTRMNGNAKSPKHEVAGTPEPSHDSQGKKLLVPSIYVERTASTNGMAGTHSNLHSSASTPQQELLQLANNSPEPNAAESVTPQGSRPESRMASLEVQSPLASRPPSTISEVPSRK